MKELRNFMRDFTCLCIVSAYSIDNRILRTMFRIVVYLIIFPLILALSYLMFIPMIIKYGKNAKNVDIQEQMEWLKKKYNQIEESL